MSKGIVVDHKESNVRYAISEHNFNGAVHTKVRDLVAGETVIDSRLSARATPKRKVLTRASRWHSFRLRLTSEMKAMRKNIRSHPTATSRPISLLLSSMTTN